MYTLAIETWHMEPCSLVGGQQLGTDQLTAERGGRVLRKEQGTALQ